MIRRLLLIAAATLLLASVSSVAYADSVTIVQGQTLTFTFQPAGYPNTSATATVTLNGNQLIVNLTNTSTDGTTRIKGIGLNTTPNITVNSFSATGGMSDFQFSSGGGGLGNMEAIASSTGNKTLNQGASNSGSVTFSLNTTYASLSLDQITVHFISLPDGNSIKVNGNGNNPIPEPATMVLLGTGLAGVAAKIRKRRKAAKE
ncbi:MAG TPA: PEP-CTERM sorting domain-containing protein [Pyrinomonadaceae bacterium]